MQKFGVSLILAFVIAITVVAGIYVYKARNADEPDPEIAGDVATLRGELARTRAALSDTRDAVARLEERLSRLETRRATPTRPVPAPAAETAQAPAARPQLHSPEMRDYVFALIEEERQLKAEEDMRLREERRREEEELRAGPYERFNLKVNSFGKVLGLDDNQKQRYYELSSTYWDALQDLRKNTNWREEDARTTYRETHDRLQKEFAAEVEGLLSADQLEAYKKLPGWTQNIQNLSRVPEPGQASAGASRVRAAWGNAGRSVQAQGSP